MIAQLNKLTSTVARVNIVLLGRMKHGKSSFVNTVASIAHGSYKHERVASSDVTGTATKDLGKINIDGMPGLLLWDTWGWDGSKTWQVR